MVLQRNQSQVLCSPSQQARLPSPFGRLQNWLLLRKSTKPAFEELEAEVTTNKHKSSISGMKVGGSSVLDTLMEQEMAKEQSNRKDYWPREGIIVKVMSKELADKGYFKGVVIKVTNKNVGGTEMLDRTHVPGIDQEELETVIRQIGGLVRIVNGAYRGSNARLLSIDTDKYCTKVKVEKGIYDGRVLQAVDYEDICKISNEGSCHHLIKSGDCRNFQPTFWVAYFLLKYSSSYFQHCQEIVNDSIIQSYYEAYEGYGVVSLASVLHCYLEYFLKNSGVGADRSWLRLLHVSATVHLSLYVFILVFLSLQVSFMIF